MESRIKFSLKSNEVMGTLDSSPLWPKQRLRSRDAKPLAQSHQAVKLGPTGVNKAWGVTPLTRGPLHEQACDHRCRLATSRSIPVKKTYRRLGENRRSSWRPTGVLSKMAPTDHFLPTVLSLVTDDYANVN